ncbi:MAG: MmcQ/YjbR family DNA-binding protein [Prevotellaceae bacterium]|jgi:predicted DNA-binding protein (MmcQ/YjbR family)|nr:MmcQ/YjbR family DNA-binding protein [Prevotellaceae bacterium]
MNVEEVRDFCLSLKNTTESFPFDDVSLVFKVENKMYLLISLDNVDANVAVKCDPEQAEILRDHYAAVTPAYHFNKKYWNNIYLDRDMPDGEIKKWIRHSYDEVVKKLPKKIRERYSRAIKSNID